MFRLERLQVPKYAIVFGVGDFRVVEYVVGIIVSPEQLTKLLESIAIPCP
jgi:hypothetical protein